LTRAAFAAQLPLPCRELRQNLRAFWKNADPDIPILKEAKTEYAKLQ